ncbi:hypothetical protein Pint_11789 [Pistacia integerrima]|uniref:Uncharacterized protein n=1 Tax=Pistacia integerrima TaxID=434235 RepID=A0ACC0XLN4_9ROSI|nr:hypothetical protein Pint_11789 [Pistacia integerrima]
MGCDFEHRVRMREDNPRRQQRKQKTASLWKKNFASLWKGKTQINPPEAPTLDPEIGLILPTAVEYPLTEVYKKQVKLYEAAKADDVGSIRNFFFQSDKTAEELASSFLYETVDSSNTLLHVAASFDSEKTVGFIAHCQIGLPILDRKNSKGDTALHVAAKAGHLSTVRALICPVSTSKDDCNSPLSFRPRTSEDDYDRSFFLGLTNEDGSTALQEALINVHKSVAEALIKADPQVSFNLNNESKTPLCLAAEAGSLICLKSMLESTEAVNPEEKLKGKSPIHAAILSANASAKTATGNDLEYFVHLTLY